MQHENSHIPDPKVHMSEPEVAAFESQLSSCEGYLEFGSGGSTLAAVRSPAKRITSVESDGKWVEDLSCHPGIRRAIDRKRLTFQLVDIGPTRDWGFPVDDSKIRQWHHYWSEPFLTKSESFDLILIDGRFRVACALAAAIFAPAECKILIHDYKLRTAYSEVEKFFDTIDVVDTLYLMKRRSTLNYRSLYASILRYQFQVS